MFINSQVGVTQAVLREVERASTERFKHILSGAVKHLHDFVRDVKLTEAEFQQICACIARVGR